MAPQVPPGTYTDHMRHATQLAHHQLELALAQLPPHVLLPGALPMCVETTQPAPSVPAGATPAARCLLHILHCAPHCFPKMRCLRVRLCN